MNGCVEMAPATQRSEIAQSPLRTDADSEAKKQTWLRRYSRRLLGEWSRWETPLGVACDYADQIRKDMAGFYEDPLKRTFIEATYSSDLPDTSVSS
jgi:hypothetical protein